MFDAASWKASWKGIFPIVSVPFQRGGALDYRSFLRTLEYLEKTPVSGMVLFGIASEFYKLSAGEEDALLGIYASFPTAKKKIASITDHATFLARHKAQAYQDLGLDGLMLLAPFFLSPSKSDILEHIQAVASAVQIPVIVQIAAQETGIRYSLEELSALREQFPHLAFKIEGSPLPASLIQTLRTYDALIFNGYAGKHMLEALDLGCSGIMPGCSFTEVYSQIYSAYGSSLENANDKAKRLH
ncbi:MAG: dihydrodipicolinate synthase family protein, partial [Spirochaetota bacterium]